MISIKNFLLILLIITILIDAFLIDIDFIMISLAILILIRPLLSAFFKVVRHDIYLSRANKHSILVERYEILLRNSVFHPILFIQLSHKLRDEEDLEIYFISCLDHHLKMEEFYYELARLEAPQLYK